MIVTIKTRQSVGLYDAVLDAFPLLVSAPDAEVQIAAAQTRVRT